MALAGPRLDRPSAIGDEGRPRGRVLWIGTLSIILVIALTGYLEGLGDLLSSLGLIAGMTVVGVALFGRESFLTQLVGLLSLVGFGSVFFGIALVAPFVGFIFPTVNHWLIVATGGFSIALLGMGLTWADAGDTQSLRRATVGIGIMGLTSSVTFVLLVIALAVIGGIGLVLSGATTEPSPAVALVVFLLVSSVTAFSLALTLFVTPVTALWNRLARASARKRVRKLTGGLALGGALCLVLLVVVIVLLLVVPPGAALPAELALFGSPVVIWPLLGLAALGLLAGAITVTLRVLTRQFASRTRATLAAVVAGCLFTLLMIPTFISVVAMLGLFSVGVVIYLVFIGPLILFTVFATAVIGTTVGILPDRAGGPAIAAVGMLIAAIGLSRVGPLLAFLAIASALLVWLLSTYGLELTAELGHLPDTGHLELVAAIVTVAVGAVAVLALLGVDFVRTTAAASVTNTVALLLIATGVLLLSIPLRS